MFEWKSLLNSNASCLPSVFAGLGAASGCRCDLAPCFRLFTRQQNGSSVGSSVVGLALP
jgi:hypothetical protein